MASLAPWWVLSIIIGIVLVCICAIPYTFKDEDTRECSRNCVALFIAILFFIGVFVSPAITGMAICVAIFGGLPCVALLAVLKMLISHLITRTKSRYKTKRIGEIWNFLNDLDSRSTYCQYYDEICRNFKTMDDLKVDKYGTGKKLKKIRRMEKEHFVMIMNELFPSTKRRDVVFGYVRRFNVKIPDELVAICVRYYGNYEWNEEYGKRYEQDTHYDEQITVGSYCYCGSDTYFVVVKEVLGNGAFKIIDLFEQRERISYTRNLTLIHDESKLQIAKRQHESFLSAIGSSDECRLIINDKY